MQEPERKQILVVDDQAIERKLLRHYLAESGYTVAEAGDGEQAVSLARKSNYDGILLDLRMPGIDGIETCRRMRALEHHKHTPILVITALDESQALSAAFEAGCDDFIAKPINSAVLNARLKSHIQRTELYGRFERVQKTLNRYVSPITQKIAEQYAGTGQYPPPQKQELCILFTDIRGFTQMSQKISPEQLFALLNQHLASQVELIYQYGGYVDKYAGDGVMAVFEGDRMESRMCRCAVDIISHAKEMIDKEQAPHFAVGCGLHKGITVIGNIGSPEHLDYSVVGEPVNLAARLCGYAGPMSIIVSSGVYSALQDKSEFDFSTAEEIAVKGFERKITVYRLNTG